VTQAQELLNPAAEVASPACGWLPHINHALQEMTDDGVEPFYGRASLQSQSLRHCIGGPRAASMQKGFTANTQAASSVLLTDIDKPRQLYLDGFSPGFLASLDADVWPVDPWQRAKPKRAKQNEVTTRRPLCNTRILGGGPSHAQQRQQDRDLASMRRPQKVFNVHALLTHVSPPPSATGRPSPAAWLRGGSASVPRATGVDDECSWPSASRIFPRRGSLRALAR